MWACILVVFVGVAVAQNTENYNNLAQQALDYLEQQSNNFFARKVSKIVSVKEQTVSGKLITLNLELSTTYCNKGTVSEQLQLCSINSEEPQELCKVKIWSQPWHQFIQVTHSECQVVKPNLESQVVEDHQGQDVHVVTKKVLKEEEEAATQHFTPLLDNASSQRSLKKLQSHHSFKAFVKKYERDYENRVEYEHRFSIFKQNMKKVQFLRETEQGTGVYGASQFADLTEQEFKQRLGLTPGKFDHVKGSFSDSDLPDADIPDVPLPKEFDWRSKGAVTPVKNQGACGSCWAFSVTGNVEGQWQIQKGQLLSLSEQELVDCDRLDNGCNGGLPENAYKAIKKLGGLETEKDYKYDGMDEKCHFDKTKVKATIDGGVAISKNETEMAQWLLKNGPISIGINANAMQFYMGGVSHPWKFLCPDSGIDHGVLIVGFGEHKYPIFKEEMPFWIVKNSWGTGWGEQGYYRVFRGDGTCGVNQMTSSAVVV